jgi:hypothetical protein
MADGWSKSSLLQPRSSHVVQQLKKPKQWPLEWVPNFSDEQILYQIVMCDGMILNVSSSDTGSLWYTQTMRQIAFSRLYGRLT